MRAHFHARFVSKLENVGPIFNFYPMAQMAKTSPVIVVKIASQIRGFFVFMSEYVCYNHYLLDSLSPKGKVHRCDIRWAGRPSCETASTKDYRKFHQENLSYQKTNAEVTHLVERFPRKENSLNCNSLSISFVKPQKTLYFFLFCNHISQFWHLYIVLLSWQQYSK